MSGERGRLRVLQLGAFMLLAVLVLQLARLQLLGAADVPSFSSGESARVIETEAPRGLIYDREGRVLAQNEPVFSVQIVPDDVPADANRRREAFVALERRLGVPYARLDQAYRVGLDSVDPRAPITVLDGLDRVEAIAARAAVAALPGVQVSTAPRRVYDGGELLGHILGHVGPLTAEDAEEYLALGYPLDARVGQAGLELVYEQALRGEAGRRLVIADPTGREVAQLGAIEPGPGDDLVLAIDLDFQRAVTEALERGIRAGLSTVPPGTSREPLVEAGAAVVMDVETGEVLALVSLPSYDVNLFGPGGDAEALEDVLTDPARPLIDRTYMEVKAPGSTFKPLVAAAALQEGVATPGTLITSTGALLVRDQYNPEVYYRFGDWAAHGTLDLYGGIARSSDVYFYYLAGGYYENGRWLFEGLGPERISAYARAAGLGSPTGIDLPGEADGLVPTPEWKQAAVGEQWVLGDTYTYGIGQGYLAVTPLQMAVLAAAIANGGDVLVPHVVRGVRHGEELELVPARVSSRLPVDAEHLAVIREAMRRTAGPGGTGATGQPAGVTIGGKTGTAEFGQRLTTGEFPTHGWYIGFAPYDDPEIAVAVYLEYGVGSAHAGPVAREIFEAYFADPPGDAGGTAQAATR